MLSGTTKITYDGLRSGIKYHNFRGTDLASDMISEFMTGEEILVYFDPDIDGLIAGFFVCRYLSMKGFHGISTTGENMVFRFQ